MRRERCVEGGTCNKQRSSSSSGNSKYELSSSREKPRKKGNDVCLSLGGWGGVGVWVGVLGVGWGVEDVGEERQTVGCQSGRPQRTTDGIDLLQSTEDAACGGARIMSIFFTCSLGISPSLFSLSLSLSPSFSLSPCPLAFLGTRVARGPGV